MKFEKDGKFDLRKFILHVQKTLNTGKFGQKADKNSEILSFGSLDSEFENQIEKFRRLQILGQKFKIGSLSSEIWVEVLRFMAGKKFDGI